MLLESSGWDRIVTRGTKEFHDGQVDVSIRTSQTRCEEAEIKVELPRWRVALAASMFGVARVAFS